MRWAVRDNGFYLCDAGGERFLAFVEPGYIEFALEILAGDAGGREIARDGNAILQIVGEQREPFVIFPLIDQFGFVVEELFDLESKRHCSRYGARYVACHAHEFIARA
jgi:hypothetical protein